MGKAFETAKRLYKAKRYQKALAVLLSVDEDPAENPELSYYLGLCYSQTEQYDEALLYLEQVVTTHPDFLHLYQCRLLLAVIYTNTERYSLAEYEIKQLIDGGYASVQVYSVYSYLLFQQNRSEESLKYINMAMELDPENPNVLNSSGYIEAEEGYNLDKALDLCKQAVRKQPEQAAYLDSLGWVYYKLGKFSEAHRYIKRAYQLSDDHPIIKSHLKAVAKEIGAID
ncbi:MAG: tetratricopeptide repeat protein [Spirochaetaceae bacterium]|nr:tetratricopeptide repeat protein [Spirochaetaceae bacterium]MCF7946988.1 tetratricopeptide repeat protein [Spirochaetia bacterium]MCF7950195.1 tetratricopeptide repeat protein [Spirochaetaceae bacterium]